MAKKYLKKSSYFFKVLLHRLKILTIILLIITVLVALYWTIFLSNFFQIKEIKSKNDVDIFPSVENDIRNFLIQKNNKFVPQFINKLFPQYQNHKYNILLLSQKELTSYLKNKYHEIYSIHFDLDLKSNILFVDIKTREIAFLVCGNKECFFSDLDGILFLKAPQISGTLINTIYLNTDLYLGQQIFTFQEMNILNKIFAINNNSFIFKIKNIQMSSPQATTIILNTINGWQLLINFNSDLNWINEILKQLFEDELHSLVNKQNNILYIDVRDLPQIRYKLRQ